MARAKTKIEEKVLPSLVEVEDNVLGTIMLYEGSLKQLMVDFKPCVFYRTANQRIAETILYLSNNNIHPDIINVQIELKKRNILDDIGGVSVILDLVRNVASDTQLNHKYVAVVEQYLRREFIRLTHEYSEKAYDNSVDIFEMIEISAKDISDIDSFLSKSYTEKYDDVITRTIDNIFEVSDVKYVDTYKTGDKEFDEKVGIFPESLMILSGESGSGKTKFLSHKIFQLLTKNPNVSVYWCTFEDSPSDILRTYISPRIFATKKQLKGRTEERLSQGKLDKINILRDKLNKFDIVFEGKRKTVAEIRKSFLKFCDLRKGKFCILIIDNIMLLGDQRFKMQATEKDDFIVGEIKDTLDASKSITPSSIIMLHHLTGEYLKDINIKSGYRPTKEKLRGSTRYHDVSTQILMINYPKLHKDLVLQYPGYFDVMNHLFIVGVEKNRDDSNAILRYYADLDYNLFKNVTEL